LFWSNKSYRGSYNYKFIAYFINERHSYNSPSAFNSFNGEFPGKLSDNFITRLKSIKKKGNVKA